MKTIIEQRRKTKVVYDGFEDVTIYVAKNGTRFATELEATKYETKLFNQESFNERYKFRKWRDVSSEVTYDVIYIAELSDDVLSELKLKYRRKAEFKIGWNLLEIDDSGDYTFMYVHRLETLITDKQNELNELIKFQKELNENSI